MEAHSIRVAGTVAFAGALTTYVLLDELLVPQSLGGAGRVVVLVLSTLGVYSAVYGLLYWLLTTRMFRLVAKVGRLGGDWHQVFTISRSDSVDYRHGVVSLSATVHGIVLAGRTFRPDDSYSSHWQSRAVLVEGDQLEVLFVSNGLSRGKTTGTMSFAIVGSPPAAITGTWADSAPGTHCGEIRLFRSAAEAAGYRGQLEATLRKEVLGPVG